MACRKEGIILTARKIPSSKTAKPSQRTRKASLRGAKEGSLTPKARKTFTCSWTEGSRMPLQQLPVNVAPRHKKQRKEDVSDKRIPDRSRNTKSKCTTQEIEEHTPTKCSTYSNTISMQLDLSVILDASSEEDSSPSEGLTGSTNVSNSQDFPGLACKERCEAPMKRRHLKDSKEKSCMTRSKVEKDANARVHLVRSHLNELYGRITLKVKMQKRLIKPSRGKQMHS